MSRLLHAAARGARIQALDKNLGWILSSHCPLALSNDTRPYRIHPADEHLQYGPISTALREMAEGVKYDSSWEYYLANTAANEFHAYFETYFGGLRDDCPLFYLILAECLADEGM